MLCVLDTGINPAKKNMELDKKLLDELTDTPILHLYDWEGPSATYGYFISPEKHLDLVAVEQQGLSLARRPTGGGIVFHIWDYAFSFLMPSSNPYFSMNPLENYKFVNQIVLEVMKDFFSLEDSVAMIQRSVDEMGQDCQNFCMAKPTQYDVVYKGAKIAGAAQRKTKQGYLHQGTISLCSPQENLLREVLLSKKDVLGAMNMYSFCPLGQMNEKKKLEEVRASIRKSIVQVFIRKLFF